MEHWDGICMQCVFRVRRRFNYNFSLVFYAGADIDSKAVADAGEMLCATAH